MPFTLRPLYVAVALACALPVRAAPISSTELPEILVLGEAGGTYRTPMTTSATRTETPIEHIPQSVVVVPKAMIEDQGATTLSDALRNVSNVNAVDARDSNNVGFKIRGFTSATVVDGVAMPGYFANQESLVNVDRIDVIKGPAGGLFGSSQGAGSYGTLGGTVAITTSEPERTPYRQVGVSAGSFDAMGAFFDLNQPMGEQVAIRLAGEVSKSDSETDGVFFKKTSFSPSVSWTPSQDSKVVLRLRHLDSSTLDYSGLPLNGTMVNTGYTLPRSLFITATGLPDTTNESDGANLRWTQRLSNAWKFSLTAAYTQTEVDQRGVWAVTPPAGFPTGSECFGFGGAVQNSLLCGARLWDEWHATTISPSLTGVFAAGAAKHTLNLGVDYEKTRDDAFMSYSNFFGAIDPLYGTVDLTNPTFPAWAEPLAPATPDQQNRYTSTVAYVQDQIDLGDWHLLASLRHSQIKVRDINTTWGINNDTSTTKTTPRLGAVYEFTPHVSVFAGYGEGIKVPTVSIFTTPPKPEEYKQAEVGLRLKNLAGVTASAVLFDLKRKNASVADPLNLGQSIQTGEQRSKGLDLDLTWQATPSWAWIAAFTSQTAEISEDTNPALVGRQLFNVPERSARLATRYEIRNGDLAGLGMGLGLTHHSELAGNSTNTFFTPSATVWDVQVSYRLKGARLGLNISNLTDKKYYVPSAYFGGGQVTPAAPRTFTATSSFNF